MLNVARSAWNLLEVLNQRIESGAQHCEGMLLLLNQVLFFLLCDRIFCPEDHLTGLYSLLFYNILCYLLHYVHNVLDLPGYSPYVRVTDRSGVRHLAMTVTKVVLDLTKGITFLITAVFVLLVFGLEQGLEHFSPTWTYGILTAVYFGLTERACQEKLPWLLSRMNLEVLESLEVLWAPVLARLASSLASLLAVVAVTFWCTGRSSWSLGLVASYVNVYLGLRTMDRHLKALLKETGRLRKFRFATRRELSGLDDVCAVCLQRMSTARVTPCRHTFHGDCLRRCLKDWGTCPMCKRSL